MNLTEKIKQKEA